MKNVDIQLSIPKQCQKVLDIFEANGYEAYLVGGCVRDSILGKQPYDWDICTEALPEEILRLFQNYRVILTGLQHGTVTVLIDKMPIEITTYRIDGEYLDNRHPKEVIFTKKLWEDLSRRDFTINALAYHPKKGIIDCFEGLEDLKKRQIRAVGNAVERFHEDGLRIMRAIRFATVLNFSYDDDTEQAILTCSYLLKNIATERIQVELNKILLSPWVKRGLNDLYRFGCFSCFLPEMCHTYGFEQNNPYHKYDVFQHTLESVSLVENDIVLRLAMLLHDVGKPFVWENCYEGNDCFPLHEVESEKIAKKFLQSMHYDNRTIDEVCKLIINHNLQILDQDVNLRVHLSHLGPTTLEHLLNVKKADLAAQNELLFPVVELIEKMKVRLQQILERNDCYSLKQLAINGSDMKALGYEGKEIGACLQEALEEVLQDPQKNEREYLLRFVQKRRFKK